MKRILKKTFTVTEIFLFLLAPIGLIGGAVSFWGNPSTPAPPKPLAATIKPDSVPLIEVSDTSAFGRLSAAVDSISADEKLIGGSWSFYLVTADSQRTILAENIQQALVPASVTKVLTTATALQVLGGGFRFSTYLQVDGEVDVATRILHGNVYIRGTGDPSLGSETFGSSIGKVVGSWTNAIRQLGVDSIDGMIIGDAEAFERDPVPGGWAWEDMQGDYGAFASGLSIHENQFTLNLTASGGGVSLRSEPRIPGLKLYNQVVSAGVAKSYAYVAGAPYQMERTVIGEVNGALETKTTIPDPALFCAQKLYSELRETGIAVRDSFNTMRLIRFNGIKLDKKERRTIQSLSSPALSDLVYHTNQVSQNFYAESILKALAHRQLGYGSSSGGASVVLKHWKERGVDMRGFSMVDGSGISRFNTISSKQLVQVLCAVAKDSVMFPTFWRSLPVAGESGTIRKLADGTLAEGNLRAKSGTMSRVKTYAGYVRTRSGKLLAFSMMANNTGWETTELRDKFERLFVLMAELN